MDGCRFCALTESYLNSPPLANATEEGRRSTNVAQRWAITASRSTNCPAPGPTQPRSPTDMTVADR